MAAAFLCGASGIVPSVIDNQAAYLQGWLNVLKGDKRLVIAAGQAQRAADWIMGERQPFASATQPTATLNLTQPDSSQGTCDIAITVFSLYHAYDESFESSD